MENKRFKASHNEMETMQQILLWQLSDSALPIGGFVASGGLEAACQSGQVTSLDSFVSFLRTSLHSYAHTTVPFVVACHAVAAAYVRGQSDIKSEVKSEVTLEQAIREIVELDQLYHVSTLNPIVRRASKAQGVAMMMLYSKSFMPNDTPDMFGKECPNSPALVGAYKQFIRKGEAQGHLPLCFPLLLASLGIDLASTLRLHLYQFLRAGISAGVRLNLVGPYKAQSITCQISPLIDSLLSDETLLSTPPDLATQTSPTIDIVQALHDNLYSRIFNS
ncbi:hypothetical protein DSO57_1003782 [Entomophthora muscae]|uniref:Uncharacterized protein n=1 Tax=Entomophthora muscae TaxID=34485 RepID=A0ACC2TJR3_9FUNG|nr:hypothetical protein DSO57_1003782 [Entomophthora muscae]